MRIISIFKWIYADASSRFPVGKLPVSVEPGNKAILVHTRLPLLPLYLMWSMRVFPFSPQLHRQALLFSLTHRISFSAHLWSRENDTLMTFVKLDRAVMGTKFKNNPRSMARTKKRLKIIFIGHRDSLSYLILSCFDKIIVLNKIGLRLL